MSDNRIEAGQIWIEVDPRQTRYIRVRYICHGGKTIAIETVVPMAGGKWMKAPRGRSQEANAARFNGKRGGYSLYAEAA